ncbi:AMP-binding protein [Halopseudomonas pertucinogena]|uniref:AMP-binding protein n=1 Tax=Halopseudomonas pertucinogena TaxID=86175 RepID=A0ABQ2CLR2_9GAMM|nr:AMP-binding protein [Halopseudomonas pertucinogena]GGI94429.1 AMP-binding protein [Halopseudomonas pertucinogena]
MESQNGGAVLPILEAFLRHERERPESVYLVQPLASGKQLLTWAQVGDQARRFAGWLRAQGLPGGSHIAILSKNCAHWIIADLGIWMAGHVSVPLQPTLSTAALRQVVEHSEARLVVVGKLDDWDTLRSGLPPQLPRVGLPLADVDESILPWDELLRDSEPLMQPVARQPSGLASIMYTSGATGLPRGCMLSFDSMYFAASNYVRLFLTTEQDRVISWLPMSHIAERQFIQMQSLLTGMTVYFAHSRETFVRDIRRARPTLFLGTPATWHQIRQGVLLQMRQRMLSHALRIPLLGRRAALKLLDQAGLDQVRFAVVCCDTTPIETMTWYHRLGVRLFEIYGLTENCGYSHVGRPGRFRPGWCGLPNPGVECRLDDQGQLLVRSRATMLGYFRNPQKTEAALDEDGFLKTGDRGEIDHEGYLRLRGRMTDPFVSADGCQIVPQPIEHGLLTHPLVEYACVAGEGLPQPLALISLTDAARQLPPHEVERELDALLHQLNGTLPRPEQLGCLVVSSAPWQLDSDLTTATRQLRRAVLCARYHDRLGDWLVSGRTVVWE